MSSRKILVTGVYGLIAGAIYSRFREEPERYDVYGLARRQQPSDRAPDGRRLDIPDDKFHLVDLTDWDRLHRAIQGMDVVIHMAADPRSEASWENILHSNVIGSYHVFEACRQAAVKRVIYASSVMVSGGYQSDEPYRSIQQCRYDNLPDQIPIVTRSDLPRPTEPYSASKVWGEALARTYSDVHGLSCICLRIGWVNPEDRPYKPDLGAVWCSQRDIIQLVRRCVEADESLRFDIFYGVSDNRYRWVDIDRALEVVGYVPQDRAEDFIG